jgi:hypothetical protein
MFLSGLNQFWFFLSTITWTSLEKIVILLLKVRILLSSPRSLLLFFNFVTKINNLSFGDFTF